MPCYDHAVPKTTSQGHGTAWQSAAWVLHGMCELARHGMQGNGIGTARARHGMCDLALNLLDTRCSKQRYRASGRALGRRLSVSRGGRGGEENKRPILDGLWKTSKLEWAGHIMRMEEERIPKKVLNGNFKYHKTSGKTKN